MSVCVRTCMCVCVTARRNLGARACENKCSPASDPTSNDLTLLSLPLISVYPDLISAAMAPHATPGRAGEFSGPITSELHSTKQRRWYFFFLLIKSHSDAVVGHFQRCKHTASLQV